MEGHEESMFQMSFTLPVARRVEDLGMLVEALCTWESREIVYGWSSCLIASRVGLQEHAA